MRRLLLVALTALVVTACASGPSKPGPTDGSDLNFSSANPDNSVRAIIVDDAGIRGDHFDLSHAHVGEAVVVINRGTKDHGLTSDTVDTGTLRPGESTTVFLTETGTIELRDRADPSHRARIEVSAASESS